MSDVIEVMARASLKSLMPHRDWSALGDGTRKDEIAKVEAQIRALTDAGYAIVPVEPTMEMLEAPLEFVGSCRADGIGTALLCWKAMITAHNP